MILIKQYLYTHNNNIYIAKNKAEWQRDTIYTNNKHKQHDNTIKKNTKTTETTPKTSTRCTTTILTHTRARDNTENEH